MAYNPNDGEIYGVAYNDQNASVLYTIDKMMGAVTEVGTVGMDINTLACDPDGTFYCNEFGTSKVYSFTLETMAQPTFMMEVVNEYDATFATMGAQAMEYDPNTGNVVWTSYYYEEKSWGNWDYSYLYEIHPETNTYTLHNDMSHQLVALVIPQEGKSGDWADPTDEILVLELSKDEVNLLRGNSERLSVTILPWNVADHSVVWTVEDPTIADVNQYGLITGLNVGTTTITVTSKLDPNFCDTVTVTVDTLPVNLEGVLLDVDGNPMMFTWDMLENHTWTAGVALDTVLLSATKTANGDLLGVDASAKTVLRVDPVTGTSTELGTWESQIYDMAYSNLFSDEETDRVHMISGSFWIPAKDPSNPNDNAAWDLFDYIFDKSYAFEFVAIATGDIYTIEDAGQTYEAEELFFLDDNGHVWKLYAYADGDFYNATEPVCYTSNLEEMGYTLTRLEETMLPLCSMVVGEDGNLYFSGYNGKTNVFYQLVLNEETQTCEAVPFANTGEDVWPAFLTEAATVCRHANTELRGAQEVTCTEDGYTGDTYCVDCGELVEEGEAVKAQGHQMGQWEVHTAATCTEDGEERSYCANCDHYESRVIEAQGHQMGQWEVHTAATCTEDGEERSSCANCDHYESRVIEANGHSHEVTDSKAATCTEDGHTTYTCHCGDTYTETLSAQGHSYVDGTCAHCGHVENGTPDTGDVNIFAIVVVAMFALAADVILISKKRTN